MTGHWLRLNRLFCHSGRAVIVAVDHGEFFGPTSGIIDLPGVIDNAEAADGILLSPGMMAHCAAAFDHRGAPVAIVRLNWSTVYCGQWGYHQAATVGVIGPEEALALGADVCLASLTLTGEDEARDAANVELFSRLASAKRKCGIPLIGEFYPAAPERLSQEKLHATVYTACRIITELGADAIKTFYTGPRFAEVVQSTPVPVLALGAEKLPNEVDALQLAHDAVAAGARGVVFGRNVIQAEDPAAFLAALRRVVHDGAGPREAAVEAGLA
jgi:DhnA family fructose-bisphosphate aldolase class Ia